jgi:uncharacterized membrane protein YjjP (DUF1212 family)
MPAADDAHSFLVDIGASLIASGTPIYEVESLMEDLAPVIGLDEVEVSALPTMVFVQGRGELAGELMMAKVRSPAYELGRLAGLYALIDAIHREVIDLVAARIELARITAHPDRYPVALRALGSGVLGAGFALVLQPSLLGLVVSAVLGTVVGAMLLIPRREVQAIVPALAPFVVTMVVLGAEPLLTDASPVRIIASPLILVLPGAAITTGAMELAAGQTVSGASRLVQGLMVLLLMAIGTVVAAVIMDAPSARLTDRPVEQLAAVYSLLALVLLTIGFHLFMSAPTSSMPWILLVLIVAYGVQRLTAMVVPDALSAFFGALAMTPLVNLLSRWRRELPDMLLFLPAFLLLVPGAAGFIGVTGIVGADETVGFEAFETTLLTVIAITLGVLIGSMVVRSPGRRRALRTRASG